MAEKTSKGVVIGALAIMLAALLWSLDGIFIRPQLYEIPAVLVVFLEHALGFIVLSPFIIIYWHKIRTLRRQDWLAIFWVSAIGGVVGTLFITKAFFAAINGEVTFATVVILQKLQPVFALIMARLILGERLRRRFYVWAGIAILAAYFLAFGQTGLDLSGIAFTHQAAWLAVIAAVAFGSSTVFGKRIVNHLNFAATASMRFALTAILAFGLVLVTNNLGNISNVGAPQWGYLSLIVISSGAMALFIYYYGLRKVSASTATICELFWPLSAVILDYIINRNILGGIQIIAGIAMLIAIYFVVRTGKTVDLIFTARVRPGRGRGQRMGLPTINLDAIDLDIPYGVYRVKMQAGQQSQNGILHYGRKETFREGTSMELIVKDYVPNITDKKVKIQISQFIRNVIKFKDTEKLKEQIKKDIRFLDSEYD